MSEDIRNNTDIDYDTFSQILEMDDDEESRDFSKEIVVSFFEQAQNTIEEMKKGIKTRDLEKLSSLGHYLKGSSATLGLIKIKDACEAIQHLGARLDEPGQKQITDLQESLNRIQKKLDLLTTDYQSVEKTLRIFYRKL